MRLRDMLLALTGFAMVCPLASALDVGDRAPALSIAEWVQGKPVDLNKGVGGKVYMVEFWATWCPPCKVSIPLLSRFQNKYKEKLDIIGVTSTDPRNTPRDVRRFVKKQGPAMSYTVALDDGEKTTRAYLAAAGVQGIPYAFLVDRKGRIVWHGSPLDPAVEDILPKVIDGSYDVDTARKEANRLADLNKRFQQVYLDVQLEHWSRAWDGLIGILKIDPGNLEAMDGLMQVYLSEKRDKKTYRAWVQSHIERYQKDAQVMQRLARILCSNTDFPKRLPDLAIEAARAGYENSDKHDATAIATYALALYQIGDLDRAIALQREAVSVVPQDQSDSFQEALGFYTQCKRLQGQIAP